MSDLPEHVRRNREVWDRYAARYVEPGRRSWASDAPSWGIFGVPESELGVLPRRLDGLDAIELGCGTAYLSAWLARRGARPVGIDNSPAQLETARRYQQEFGIEFPLHLGNAEQTPFSDNSFDLAISEYGASIRLLRSSGFEVEDLIEVRPPADATSRHPNAPVEWARRWPVEEIWKARKRS